MRVRRQRSARSVFLLALPECSASVLYGLYDVLSSVGETWSIFTGEDHGVAPFDVRIVGHRQRAFRAAGGALVGPDITLSEASETDVVIVPDVTVAPRSDSRGRFERVAPWLRQHYRQGAVVCSVCTGSVVLADAGLLDGQAATTHWALVEHFHRFYPDVKLCADRVLVQAGPGHRLITTGGYGAWEDLALYLVSRFRGPGEAVRTAKLWVLGDRSAGQLPFAVASKPRRHDDAVIANCQDWIGERYAIASPVTRMIERSSLTVRTFKRRFRAATGYTPVEYVQTLRVEAAKQLLENTDRSTEDVGFEVGYEDPAFFRKLFKRRTGVTPARYRQQFRGLGAPPDAPPP